ncbi:polysaccharide deacetylase [Vibrio tubiashii]|nr:polysaccharide deacetylase [Vibrio tubiashii]
MNILMALSQLEVTGAEVYATSVGNELTARGHNVHYVSDTLTKPFKGRYFKLRFNKRSIPRRFWHVAYLIYLIKKHKIQLVHAHSRASSWSCHLACKLTSTPMVTTVHGRQPVHTSRKKFHAMGDKALPVCEAIKEQLVSELEVPEDRLEISRNGIQTGQFTWLEAPDNEKPVVTIIGRLTGPKGDLCYRLLDECLDTSLYTVKVVSGSKIEPRFNKFTEQVEFCGYTNDVASVLATSDLVIGAGRVAMESLLCGRPTLAIGEAKAIGLIDENNIQQAMASNFGDIGSKDLDIDFSAIAQQVKNGLQSKHCYKQIVETIKENYSLTKIVDQIEHIYQTIYVEKIRKEMPIIMYHRFIKNDSEKGVHGTYLHIDMLEKHFKLIKKMGFETITFKDLSNKGLISRLEYGKRYIIITVDDGYKDNYELLLPLLKKYNFKAVIYVVTGETFNRWDVENDDNPERPVPLMNQNELKALSDSGLIEIGGHTVSHPHLNTLTPEKQEVEIEKNKEELEGMLNMPLTSFAYPYGSLDADSKRITERLGYQFAVATNSGPLATHQDPFQIRRIAIFPRTDVFGLWRKIRGNYLLNKFNNYNSTG